MKRLLVRPKNEPSVLPESWKKKHWQREGLKDSNCQSADGRQSLERLVWPQSGSESEQNALTDLPIDVK